MGPYFFTAMDHRYIDENSVAERYVGNALPPEERSAFEEHLVDCQECTDRFLLAGMFRARRDASIIERAANGAKLVLKFKKWQLLVLLAITALLLLAIPTVMIRIWQFFQR